MVVLSRYIDRLMYPAPAEEDEGEGGRARRGGREGDGREDDVLAAHQALPRPGQVS